MNELLVKVVQFLIIPESVLSVIFLVIFFVCFVYGIGKILRCRKFLRDFRENGPVKFRSEQSRINQRQFVGQYLTQLSANEVRINDLANLFVSIGILGTFIGLGVAIHGAAELLSSDKVDLLSLNSILGIIAFKFQTSVWGTMFSILFQVFVVEPYFQYKSLVLGEVESAIYADAVSLSTAMEWQLAELQGMHAGQSDVKNAILEGVDQQARLHNTLIEDNDSKASQFRSFAANVLKNQSEANDFIISRQKEFFVNASEQSQNNMDALRNSLTIEMNQLGDKQAGFFEKSDAEHKSDISELGKQISLRLTNFFENQGRLSDSMMQNSRSNFKAMSANLAEQLGQQRNSMIQIFKKESELGERLLAQNKVLFSETKDETEASVKSVVDGVVKQMEQQRNFVQELIDRQIETTTKIAEQQKVLIGNSQVSAGKNIRSVVQNISWQLEQQREFMQNLINSQNEMSKQLADQQIISLNDTKIATENNVNNLVENVTGQLEQQRDFIQNLIENQNEMSMQLADQQKALFGDAKVVAENNVKSLVENVTEQLGQQRDFVQNLIENQNEMSMQLADQQKALFGDAKVVAENNVKSLVENVTEQLGQQRDFVQNLIENQNEMSKQLVDQQKALFGDTKAAAENNIRNLVENVAEQLGQQRNFIQDLVDKQTEMSMQLADQQNALLGDTKIAAENNVKKLVENVTKQLEQQRNFVQNMVDNQNEISNNLAEQQKVLFGDARVTTENTVHSLMENVSAQLSQQKDFIERVVGEQNQINLQLADQQKVLIGDSRDDTGRKMELVICNVEEQLKKQRAFIEKLIRQQSELNEVLLGDMQKSHETNANYMREGVIQQMEQYRRYAEELSVEQKNTQKTLEDKLALLTNSIDRTNISMGEYEKNAEVLIKEQENLQNELREKLGTISSKH